jgi:hypothetical protein
MDKRYQVFLSSTYADLKDERREVIQALMEMDCIPAGMELFPAADEQQWEFIKKVIDDCDYYLLIIGGRYGTVTADGISYTEKEYDYAYSAGLPVLAFIHGQPEQLPVAKSDIDPQLRARLEAFRDRVATGRLVRFWDDPKVLPGLVALSLQKTMKTQPRIGWVRAIAISDAEALREINELRKRNEALASELAVAKARESPSARVPDLAPLDAPLTVWGTYHGATVQDRWEVKSTWRQVVALLAPYLLAHPNDTAVKFSLSASFFALTGIKSYSQIKPKIDDQLFQTIKVQLMAHGLVDVQYLKTTEGGMALFWQLTKAGQATLLELRTVRDP